MICQAIYTMLWFICIYVIMYTIQIVDDQLRKSKENTKDNVEK